MFRWLQKKRNRNSDHVNRPPNSPLHGDDTTDAPAPTSRTAISESSQNNTPTVARLFLEIQHQIDVIQPVDAPSAKPELMDIIQEIEQEVTKGDQANPSKIERWLKFLLDISPDIFKITVNALANPLDEIPMSVKLTAENLKKEIKQRE